MLQVSAIQLAFTMVASPQEFYDRMRPPIEYAARNGAQIIILPGYIGWMLLGIAVPTDQKTLALGELARAALFPTVADMLRAVAPTATNFYLHLFETLARRYNVHIVAGTMIELQAGRLFNTAYLFAPEGRLLGSQRQIHRSPREIGWGIEPGTELAMYDIGSARVGLVVGTDVAYPEIARILAWQNANLLIHPGAYPAWHDESILLDLWRDTQSNQLFGAQACGVGEFRGRSAIYAPVEMTRARNGILAQAENADAETCVSAALDFESLQKNMDAAPMSDGMNDDVMRQLLGAYRGG